MSAEVKPGRTGGLPRTFLSPVFCDITTVAAHRFKKKPKKNKFVFIVLFSSWGMV